MSIDEKELLSYINKQMKANKDHLEFIKKRMGEDWVRENHEEDYYQGANTALFELAFYIGLVDIDNLDLIETVE